MICAFLIRLIYQQISLFFTHDDKNWHTACVIKNIFFFFFVEKKLITITINEGENRAGFAWWGEWRMTRKNRIPLNPFWWCKIFFSLSLSLCLFSFARHFRGNVAFFSKQIIQCEHVFPFLLFFVHSFEIQPLFYKESIEIDTKWKWSRMQMQYAFWYV